MTYSTRNTPFLQSLLFSHEDFSPCLFREPSERELEFLQYYHGVQSLLTCDELHRLQRSRRRGRLGYGLLPILGIMLLKLHLDVTDSGIPVSTIVTGANVHDSQAAIPLERMTGQRIKHLYSLMDSAYDAKPIKDFIIGNGRVPIIDPNKRRKQQRVLSPSEKQRFRIRSTVERSNSHLKDWLIPPKIMVRGTEKVSHCLMTGVLCLAAIKILQYCILPGIQKTA
ncbi:transposase [Sphaerochaeta sp. S2]|uniref:transposase n=1 Tax=Sphaerochaeta sp. S2 TaxID=2798868 RepID=UPI0018EA128C|nr:transposase [Sphaerochaeta sp. S2]MBJ2355430.1 transposase [Sphaerochaeta sp. S2]